MGREIRAYHDRSAHYDAVKQILNDAAGFIPGAALAKDLGNIAAIYGKDDVLGIPGDPAKLSDTAWERALTGTSTHFSELVDGYLRQFSIAQGYLDGHPSEIAQFQNVRTVEGPIVDFVDRHGRLDWDTITLHQKDFNIIYGRLSFPESAVHASDEFMTGPAAVAGWRQIHRIDGEVSEPALIAVFIAGPTPTTGSRPLPSI
ncbi:hypothetical protein [Mycobacterium camsae]|uniref:hypothetical protein n=1 Tax=Mycobacterium gordonae TaxID=1778 RepID=UPI00198250D0|nr:hypothetical protein [Mycobacterium gordonae]